MASFRLSLRMLLPIAFLTSCFRVEAAPTAHHPLSPSTSGASHHTYSFCRASITLPSLFSAIDLRARINSGFPGDRGPTHRHRPLPHSWKSRKGLVGCVVRDPLVNFVCHDPHPPTLAAFFGQHGCKLLTLPLIYSKGINQQPQNSAHEANHAPQGTSAG